MCYWQIITRYLHILLELKHIILSTTCWQHIETTIQHIPLKDTIILSIVVRISIYHFLTKCLNIALPSRKHGDLMPRLRNVDCRISSVDIEVDTRCYVDDDDSPRMQIGGPSIVARVPSVWYTSLAEQERSPHLVWNVSRLCWYRGCGCMMQERAMMDPKRFLLVANVLHLLDEWEGWQRGRRAGGERSPWLDVLCCVPEEFWFVDRYLLLTENSAQKICRPMTPPSKSVLLRGHWGHGQ